MSEHIDAVIAHTLAEAEAAGQDPPDQISRAVAALCRLYPALSPRDARALVRQIRSKR